MATIPKQVGSQLRILRIPKEETHETMANALAITPGTYAKIERSETDPSATRQHGIAKILKVNVKQLLSDEGATQSGSVTREEMNLLYSDLQLFSQGLNQIKSDLAITKSALPIKPIGKNKRKS